MNTKMSSQRLSKSMSTLLWVSQGLIKIVNSGIFLLLDLQMDGPTLSLPMILHLSLN